MLRSYLKSALRAIRRAKLFSVINIVGLSLGLTAAVIIGLWVHYQISYDTFNANANRIYRVTEHFSHGDNSTTLPLTPAPLATTLKQLPQVEDVVRLNDQGRDVVLRNGTREFNESDIFDADPSLFKIFTFHFLEGSADAALKDPYSVVLIEPVARKLFTGKNPIDRTINIGTFNSNHDYKVTGIISPLPGNSQFHPTVIISRISLPEPKSHSVAEWYQLSWYTYFLLRRGVPVSSVEAQLPRILSQGMGEQNAEGWKLGIQKLTHIHLHSHLLLEIEPNGNIQTVMIVLSVGIFILLVSLINFITLSVARFSDRAKEVGVRKVVGAGRKDLVLRFMAEAVILSLASGIAAISLVEVSLPLFNSISGSSLTLSSSESVLALLGTLLIGTLAGSYPALFFSSFKPSPILRKEPLLKPGKSDLRKVLVVIQFSIAVCIVIATIVARGQLTFC